jgi:hypothetical protein
MRASTPSATDLGALDAYTFGGLVLLALVIATHVVMQWLTRREWPDVRVIVQLALGTTGVIEGVRLCIVALTSPDLGPFSNEDRLFIPAAGVTLFFLSAQALVSTLRKGDGAR